MKKNVLSLLMLFYGLTFLWAINWEKPTFKTTDTPNEGTSYYLYHTGRKQMLTYGGKWGTHAFLDSTGVAALPYLITQSSQGYTFYSSQAENQGLLFRESTGTGVYTDYNYHGDASTHWAIVKNGNGTVHIKTDANDYIWGDYGYKVTSDENTYLLGWNPDAVDISKDGEPLGGNQSVYMLKPNVSDFETNWTFIVTTDYELYQAREALYAMAEKAASRGITYTDFTSVYNGTDIKAIKAATATLKERIEQGEEEDTIISDTLFIALNDSSTMIFPQKYIKGTEEDEDFITFTLAGDTSIVIAKSHIESMGTEYKGTLPNFESYKFNNKFNDQLYTDAEGEIDSINRKVYVSIGCIGKRLTPSFKLPDGVKAYINGVQQHSKETRLRFDAPVHYTLAYPKQYLYKVVKVSDEVWSTPEGNGEMWITTQVNLTEDMLSTNAPSNSDEGPDKMLDGNPSTFYHSTWGNGAYTPLTWSNGGYYGDGVTEWPYIQIALKEPLSRIKFTYITRPQTSNGYCPLGFILQGSNDGNSWNDIQTLTSEKDGLPTTAATEYTSAILNLGATYKYLRLQLTQSQRKNYLVLSEFALFQVEENPDYVQEDPVLISPAEYTKTFVPYGSEYEVKVDFLTDHPTTEYNVPRVDIWFGDKETWSSSMWIGRNGKSFNEDATIKIDGAGVFPDMEETEIQIKGRGNSSWTNSYSSKNPYRMKFATKVKPFGMTKGKSWVLLANKQSGSMTTNAIAMKIADMVETRGCNHIVPVELYVNNQYRGSYNFTEKTGFSNNSIDLDDDTNAVFLELDSYYDETYKFRDKNYNLYVNVKEPELSEQVTEGLLTETEARQRFQQIQGAFNTFTGATKDGETAMLDVDAFVRAMLVTDLVRNEELKHPKSWFLYNEDITTTDSLWTFGPVWDFDWSYGYEGTSTYFINNAEIDLFAKMGSNNIGFPFFQQLLRGSDVVKKAYYKLWTEFIKSGKLDELIEFCDDYQSYVNPSFIHNQDGVIVDSYDWWTNTGWGDGKNYATVNTNAKNWLTKRANYIYTHLDVYDISDDIIDPEEDDYGRPDRVDVAEVMQKPVDVYTIHGILVRKQVPYGRFNIGLMPGIYVVNGKKVAIQ